MSKDKNQLSKEEIEEISIDTEVSYDSVAMLKLSEDLKTYVRNACPEEIGNVVKTYYQIQHFRIQVGGQIRARKLAGESTLVLEWNKTNLMFQENWTRKCLDEWAKARIMGRWLQKLDGIGPVISAGLLAHIDITKAITTGHIWSFAGLNPDPKKAWKKGEKRPYNADLKTLAVYKMGECFVKLQNKEGAFYGNHFRDMKADEIARVDRGHYAQVAIKDATDMFTTRTGTKRKGRYGRDTEAWEWVNGCYPEGIQSQMRAITLGAECDALSPTKRNAKLLGIRAQMQKDAKGAPGSGTPQLPPAHLHARARRRTVKILLAHLHDAWHWAYYGEAPVAPYPIAHQGHAHVIECPNMDMIHEYLAKHGPLINNVPMPPGAVAKNKGKDIV